MDMLSLITHTNQRKSRIYGASHIWIPTSCQGHRYLQVEILVLRAQDHVQDLTIFPQQLTSIYPTQLQAQLGTCHRVIITFWQELMLAYLNNLCRKDQLRITHLLLIYPSTTTISIYTCQTEAIINALVQCPLRLCQYQCEKTLLQVATIHKIYSVHMLVMLHFDTATIVHACI